MEIQNKDGIFYGYRIAAACFVIQGVGIGTLMSFGIFFTPLLAEFGWSRATLSGASSVAAILGGTLGIYIGSLNDKIGPRLIMTATSCILGLGYILMSQISTLSHIYLLYGVVIGMGMSAVDVVSLSTLARWFVKRRGMMTGMVKVGTGVGQLSIPLIAGLLIASYGWRTAYIIIGIGTLVLFIVVSQILRRDPGVVGLFPDGLDHPPETEQGQVSGMTFREAVITPQFWIICLGNAAVLYCLSTITLHIVPYAMDQGITLAKAAFILSVFGGASMLSRFIIGMSIDRIGTKRAMMACFVILIGSFLWLQVASELWMLYVFAAIYGPAHGGFFTVISPIVAEFFGLKAHGMLFGVATFAGAVGGSIGPIAAGYIFDVTSSYKPAFWILTAVALGGLILISFLKPAVQEA